MLYLERPVMQLCAGGCSDGGAVAVGEESKVADAHEPWRQQMKQEAAQELIYGQGHEPLLLP